MNVKQPQGSLPFEFSYSEHCAPQLPLLQVFKVVQFPRVLAVQLVWLWACTPECTPPAVQLADLAIYARYIWYLRKG